MAKVPTRDRLVQTAADLFRHQGYSGTGVKQVLTAAEAPFGSLYHFFPDGKQELAAAALRVNGEYFLNQFLSAMRAEPDPLVGLDRYISGIADTLTKSDYTEGCPVMTVAAEVAETNDALRAVCAEIFESWVAAGSELVAALGLPAPQARRLTIQLLLLIEGAFLLAQTHRSTEPVEAAREAARLMVEQNLAAAIR